MLLQNNTRSITSHLCIREYENFCFRFVNQFGDFSQINVVKTHHYAIWCQNTYTYRCESLFPANVQAPMLLFCLWCFDCNYCPNSNLLCSWLLLGLFAWYVLFNVVRWHSDLNCCLTARLVWGLGSDLLGFSVWGLHGFLNNPNRKKTQKRLLICPCPRPGHV